MTVDVVLQAQRLEDLTIISQVLTWLAGGARGDPPVGERAEAGLVLPLNPRSHCRSRRDGRRRARATRDVRRARVRAVMESTVSALVKPKLRGVSHQVAFFVALAAGAWLLSQAKGALFWACVVYLVTLAGQFAVSALYHRPTWQPAARQWWRRLDHAFIMLLIAGTGTPLAVALPDDTSRSLLLVLWAGATLGVLRALVWISAPKWVATVLAAGLAWLMWPYTTALGAALGDVTVRWVVFGGVLYTLGALAYAAKRPNPWPTTFGYHEVFHAFVILAAACHFVAVTRVVLGLR